MLVAVVPSTGRLASINLRIVFVTLFLFDQLPTRGFVSKVKLVVLY